MCFFEPWGCVCLENEEMEVVACEVGKDPKDNLVMSHHCYLHPHHAYIYCNLNTIWINQIGR